MAKITISELAEKIGCSRTTISHVLSGNPHTRVSEQTRRKILKAVKKYNYTPNIVAQSLVTKKTRLIGMIAVDMSNQMVMRLIKELEKGISAQGYHLVVSSSDYDEKKEVRHLENLINRGVDGIIMEITREDSNYLKEYNKGDNPPLVLLVQGQDNIDQVTFDDELGVNLVMEHLIEQGHRRIGYVSGIEGTLTNDDRLHAYKVSLKKAGISYSCAFVFPGGCRQEDGQRAARIIMRARPFPTALFCFNDDVAIGCMEIFKEKGLRTPEDISIVGFDNIDMARTKFISLTSVDLPTDKLASTVLKILWQRMENKDKNLPVQKILIPPRLIIRNSSKSSSSLQGQGL